MLSLYFLESFGHRLTETFVCFGDTVHNGINLRKVPFDFLPLSKDPGARQHEEPFVFRNQLHDREYMFKLIDGLFCNNYYAENIFFYSSLVSEGAEEFGDLRHIRCDALKEKPSRKPEFSFFFKLSRFSQDRPLNNKS